MNEKELAEFVAKLPEHLRFFFEKPPRGLDAEEFHRFAAERIEKVMRHREELIAHGINADQFLAEAGAKLAEVEKADGEVEEAEDNLLNAQANLADAKYKLFKESDKVVRQLEEEKPFDPQVQEWREQLNEWARHFPKE